jgi:hypothetical protein
MNITIGISKLGTQFYIMLFTSIDGVIIDVVTHLILGLLFRYNNKQRLICRPRLYKLHVFYSQSLKYKMSIEI